MNEKRKLHRRAACAALLGSGTGLVAASSLAAQPADVPAPRRRRLPALASEHFYDAEGAFDEQRARRAYLALMRYYGFPISDNLRENLFVADFGLGAFAEVGLGGVIWVGEKEANYSSIEIFLLPDQMIPEHWHVALEDEGVAPKMESWIVRYGRTFTYGDGPATENPSVTVHPIQAEHVTARHETPLGPGEVTGIRTPLEKHWQQAGPEGCILTEVSTYHDGRAVRFTDPRITF